MTLIALSFLLAALPSARSAPAPATPETLVLPATEETPATPPVAAVHGEGPTSLATVRPTDVKPTFKLPEVVVTGEGEALVPGRREVTLPATVTKHLKAVAPAEQVTLVLPSLLSGTKGVPQLAQAKTRSHVLELELGGHLYNPEEADSKNRISSLFSHQTERLAAVRLGQVLPKGSYLFDYLRDWRDGWLEAPYFDSGTGGPEPSVPARRMQVGRNEMKVDAGTALGAERELRISAGWREHVLRLAHETNPDAHLVKRAFGAAVGWQGLSTALSGFSGSAKADWTRLSQPQAKSGWWWAQQNGGYPRGPYWSDGSLGRPHEVSDLRSEVDLRWTYPTRRFYVTPWSDRDQAEIKVGVLYDTVDHLLPPTDASLPSALPSGSGVLGGGASPFLSRQSVLALRVEGEEVVRGPDYEAGAGVRAVLVTGFKTPPVLLAPTLRGKASLGNVASVYGSFEPQVVHESLGSLAFSRDAVGSFHEAPSSHRSYVERLGVQLRIGEAFRSRISVFRDDRSGVTLWDNPYLDAPSAAQRPALHEWRSRPRNLYHRWFKVGASAIFELELADKLTVFLDYAFSRSRFRDSSLGYRTTFEHESEAGLGLRYEPKAGDPWKFEAAVRYVDPEFHTVEPVRFADGSPDTRYHAEVPAWAALQYVITRRVHETFSVSLDGEHMLYSKYADYFPRQYRYHRPHFRMGLTGTFRY